MTPFTMEPPHLWFWYCPLSSHLPFHSYLFSHSVHFNHAPLHLSSALVLCTGTNSSLHLRMESDVTPGSLRMQSLLHIHKEAHLVHPFLFFSTPPCTVNTWPVPFFYLLYPVQSTLGPSLTFIYSTLYSQHLARSFLFLSTPSYTINTVSQPSPRTPL